MVTVPVMHILNLLPKNRKEGKSPSPGSDAPVLFLAVKYHDHLVNDKSKYFNNSLYLNLYRAFRLKKVKIHEHISHM